MPLSVNLREQYRKERPRKKWFRDSYGNLSDRGFVTYLILAVVGTSVAASTPFVLGSGCGGARGEHVGYVTAIEEQKNVTWDSTVVYFKSDTESTQEDKYCVRDPLVRDALKAYAERRVPVVIRYENGLVMWRWECNGGDSIITGIHEIRER